MQYINRYVILIGLFILVVAAGVLISNNFTKVDSQGKVDYFQASSSAEVRGVNSYTNNTYGFSLEYPFNLQLKESSPSSIIIGTINDLETDSEVEIKIAEMSLKAAATESAEVILSKSLCKSNLPTMKTECTRVINENSEIATAGSNLKTFYLEEVTTELTGQEKVTEIKGPFISIVLAKTRNTQTILLIHPPLEKDQSMVKTQLIRDIASSIKLNQNPTQPPIKR